jgi:Fe-S oxidoreductase
VDEEAEGYGGSQPDNESGNPILEVREMATLLEPYKRWLYAVDIHPSAGCVACGNCYGRGPANWLADEHNTADWKCVPFDYYGWRSYTPSSFWELATKYYHGQISIDEEVRVRLFSCAQCGLCDEVCGIVAGDQRLSEIFRVFRAEIYERTGPFRGLAEIAKNVREAGNIYGVRERRFWGDGVVKPVEEGGKNEILLYVGDTAYYKLPQIAQAAANVLKMLNVGFTALKDEPNSGYELEMAGDFKGAKAQWEKVRDACRKNGVKTLVCLGAQDYHVLKRELGGEIQVHHITTFIASKTKPNLRRYTGRAAYHDPCYLARHAGSRSARGARVIEEPRRILSWIPGLEIVELRHKGRWTWCVGECGGLPWSFPDLARWRAEKLIMEAAELGVDKLITASPPELLHLRNSLGKNHVGLEILDICEVLADSISR